MYRNYTTSFLQILLILLFLFSILLQLGFGLVASDYAAMAPEFAYLQYPYLVVCVLTIGCGQVGLVAIWKLLTMVRNDTVFGTTALRWVDVIIVSAGVATILMTGLSLHATFIVQTGGPPLVAIGWFFSLVSGGAFILLMLVMRELLVTASGYRTDLETVI